MVATKYFFGKVVNNFSTQVVLNAVGRKKFEFIVIPQQDLCFLHIFVPGNKN